MIIKSLLDTDLYKFTMLNAILETEHRIKWFGHPQVKYRFKCRSGEKFTRAQVERIKSEIAHFQSLSFTRQEINYLRKLNLFGERFFKWISGHSFISGVVDIYCKYGQLEIEIRGSWISTILYEVPILAIVNQVYYENRKFQWRQAHKKLQKKIVLFDFHKLHLIEFGTRRRYSFAWQQHVVKELTQRGKEFYLGTSNVLLSKMNKTVPKGTMAHEWLQAFQALSPNILDFQKDAMDQWMLTYRGKLDVALSDVIGSKAFFDDFDPLLARAYTGIRQDSGNPFQFMMRAAVHCNNMGLDPSQRTIVFSDGLDVEKCKEIKESIRVYHFKPVFGVGTNLTNDVGFKPLQIVIKLVEINGNPVAKLSDSKGKEMCEDREYVNKLKRIFSLEEK